MKFYFDPLCRGTVALVFAFTFAGCVGQAFNALSTTRLQIEVRDQQGRPVPSAEVIVMGCDRDILSGKTTEWRVARFVTDGRGRASSLVQRHPKIRADVRVGETAKSTPIRNWPKTGEPLLVQVDLFTSPPSP